MTLIKLRLLRKHWIAVSKKRHGQWAKAYEIGTDLRIRKKCFKAWREAVAKINYYNSEIAKFTTIATAASISLAQAVAIWEGGRSADGLFRPYQDVVGVWTIGYGHTNADGAPYVSASTKPLTGVEATALLLHDLNTGYAPAVESALKEYGWPQQQKSFDALTDFCYNLGAGYFGDTHTIGERMKYHDKNGTADAMLEYDEAGGRVLSDLDRRRHWERQLFLGGSYGGAG